ncbi:sugar ABC transporter ATP-binding protein [Nocardioides speluncae]|uniref:sugar ABC transporter ATP-binding protein n=1 Tax=Nocardioides speluncae TaxID=2670337 RepID=UPI000D68E2F0|nr:sugar ABC transporter ATP-binding protein [Nocardioides speluncae]
MTVVTLSKRRSGEDPGTPVVRLTGIRKSFQGNEVVHGVDLELQPGEVHALVGENGAGKSTLMKCLAGIHAPDQGTIEIDGVVRRFRSPREAQEAGVAIVHQEFTLLPHRTVAENLFLGREPGRFGRVDKAGMERRAGEVLADLGVTSIRPSAVVSGLSVAQQQIVEIAKALVLDARVLAMDEPTAALADAEVALLYDLVRRLTGRGLAVLYVSHRLPEVFDLSSRITVMKDGAHVATEPTGELTTDNVVRLMVGRPLNALFPDLAAAEELGKERIAVAGGGNARIHDIDLTIRAGEVVGLAGLQGSGRSALARALCGVAPFTRGSYQVEGRPARIRSPRRAVRAGIAFVTEDRKGEGLALRQTVQDNVLLVRRSVSGRRTRSTVADLLREMTVVAASPASEVRLLSGGNQQKVVLAKWLAVGPTVLVVDEPTRGIDIGAKATIYQLIRDLARSGVAVLLISSELPELIGMSDRLLVMHRGRIAGELPPQSSEEDVMRLATGHGQPGENGQSEEAES